MRIKPHCVECQLLIMEEFELFDLINAAAINEHFQLSVADVFRRKYTKKTVDLCLPFAQQKKELMHDLDKKLQIEDYNLMLSIPMYFGHTIKDLEINYENFETYQANQINNYMNAFCSESLTQLLLKNCKLNSLDVIRKPFKNVENVTFTGGFEKLTYVDLKLNEIFPNLHRLDLAYAKVADPEFINREFPYLQHFTVSFMHSDGFAEQHIEKFVKKNPQTRGLQLMNSSYMFLKFLSENLKQLDQLELIWTIKNRVNYFGGDIHFKNVKKLMIKTDHQDYPEKLVFDELEELRIDCFNQLNDEWINFIVKSQILRYFCHPFSTLDDQQLLKLDEHLPDLVEFSTSLAPNTLVKTIVRFVQNCKQLKKLFLFTFFTSLFLENDSNELHLRLKPEWNMSSSNVGIILNRNV